MYANRKTTLILMFLAATAAFSTASIRTDYGTLDSQTLIGSTIWTSDTQPGWVPDWGTVLDFAADGTGVSYENLNTSSDLSDLATIPESFTWSILDDSVLEILYDDFSEVKYADIDYPYQEFVDTFGFDQEVTDFLNLAYENGQFDPPTGQVEMLIHTISSTSVVDTDLSGDRRFFWSTKQIEYSIDDVLTSLNWPGALPHGTKVSDVESLVYLPAAITNGLQDPPAPGDTWAVPHIYRPLDPRVTEQSELGFFSDVFTLEGLGETSDGLLSQRSYTWSATADGLIFDAGDERYTYLPIETDGSNYFTLATYAISDDVQLRHAQWIARGDGTGGTLANDIVQPIPFYWQAGINLWNAEYYDEEGRLLPSRVFGYSLAGDGTSFRVFGFGGENCLADESDPCFSAEGGPRWTWTANGDTIVRDRSQSDGAFLRSRIWKVLRYQPGGRAVVLEWGVWQFAPEPWEIAILPRLNTLEVIDLRDWPEEWADAEGFYPDDDTDGDGIADAADNCILVPNPTQCDGDGDRYGNHCDGDFNNDLIINGLDVGPFKASFGTNDATTDLNCDGITNGLDVGPLKTMFGQPPGPSGLTP